MTLDPQGRAFVIFRVWNSLGHAQAADVRSASASRLIAVASIMKNLFASLFLVAFAAGCSDSSDGEVGTVEPPPIPASDVDLIDNLVPHHREAIRMADEQIARGASGDVRAMAEEMRADQQREIDELLAIRAELEPGVQLRTMSDPHSERDHDVLASAAGAELDVLFLENMIPHHAGAVSLAHRAMPYLTVPKLQEIADMTVVKQTREMNEMLDMLGR